MTGSRRFQLYGRRKTKPLSSRRQWLVDTLLPRLRIELPPAGNLEPGGLFPEHPAEVWMEIGFGGGEHLLAVAADNPQTGFVAVEVFLNGIAKLLHGIDERSAGNIRIFDGDARQLLERLTPESVARLFILYPDPWTKARHHRRRLVNPALLAELFRVIKPGGELRIASDIADYVRWTLVQVRAHGGFLWCAERAADWRSRPAGWPATRYEDKAIAAGRRPTYLRFTRRAVLATPP
ncbi:MAG: tRNA (guanosine(46)-N7)-methyltransferase TrmB [Pseudomonadota bacterium]|nr:tRNA (guanosine(46)-N7)-methyltransferase TrmB [Pseudomonadota bacterium]